MSKKNRFSIFSEGAEVEADDIPIIAQPQKSPATQAKRGDKPVNTQSTSALRTNSSGSHVAQNVTVQAKMPKTQNTILKRDGEVSSLETYFIDFDVDGFGFEVYKRSTAAHRISIISRLSIGTIAAVIATVGTARITQILNSRKPRIGYDKKRVSGAAKGLAKRASRFAYYSGKMRSAMSRAALLLKGAPKTVPMWLLSAGTGAVTSVTLAKDIGQWIADAVSDWQQTFRYNFNQSFTSGDFARLNAILTAGQEARYQRDRNGVGVAISGRDIKLLSILASTTVMDIPLDIRTSATIADTLRTVLDKYYANRNGAQADSFDSLLSRVRMTLYIGDPESPQATKDDLDRISVEFKQLLLKFSRSIEDVVEWDNEDLLVPMILIINRFTKIPGVLSKIISNSFAFGEVALTKTFDEDTHELVAQIDAANNINRNDSGFLEYVKNFVMYKLGFNMDGQSGEVVPADEPHANYEAINMGGI